MVVASLLQTVVIAMLLSLGALLYLYVAKMELHTKPDEVFATVASQSGMPTIISVLLVLGVVSASFSSTGGALTSLTTSFAVDIIKNKELPTLSRKWLHAAMATLLTILILVFERWSSASTIELFYRIASFTYGPLLGMFAFGAFSRRKVCDKWVPIVAIASPIICGFLDHFSKELFNGYQFGFEILLLNAGLTMLGLFLASKR